MEEVTHPITIREAELARRQDAEERQAQFAALVERQSKFLFRIAYALLRNVPDAEDAVQVAFLKLYRSGAWQRVTDEKAFLARTVWRVALGTIGKNRTECLDPRLMSDAVSPETVAVNADWSAAVHRLVDALPEELRRPLTLSTIEELNSHQIAAVMGILEGSVRTRIMRARQILKGKMARLMENRNAR